ncbi:MAG: hypoxanthine phosphoribosyltransferase [Desulfatibacillum sp.]|nr:hypoxanthine phosphoribosyltransferase [Desulfatibacillum sp.]
MAQLTPLLSAQDIEAKVAAVARKISQDYKDSELVVIGVLNGAFIFMADLVRHIEKPVGVDFVRVSSYGSGDTSSGKHRLTKPLEIDIKGKDVLIVEDIVDSGLTMDFLKAYFQNFSPRSIEICAMIDKSQRRETPISIKYVCHKVEEGFLVGYGLDFDENYRSLPGIYTLKP